MSINSGWLYKMEEWGLSQRTHENPFVANPFRFNWYPFNQGTDATEIPTPSDWLTQAPVRVNMTQAFKMAVAENFNAGSDAFCQKGTNFWFYDWSTTPGNPSDPNSSSAPSLFPLGPR